MIACESASSVFQPKFMVPRQSRETDSPLRPRCVYSMPTTLAPWAPCRTTPCPSSFAAATAVRRADGGGIVAELDPGWDVGGNILNGGYLLAVIARAAVARQPAPAPGGGVGELPAGHRPRAGDPRGHARAGRADARAQRGRPLGCRRPDPVGPGDDGDARRRAAAVLPADAGRAAGRGVPLGARRPTTWAAIPCPRSACAAASRRGWTPRPRAGRWAGRRASRCMRAWVRLTDGSEPDPFALLLFADVLPPDQLGDRPDGLGADRAAAGARARAARAGMVPGRGDAPARWRAAGSTRTTASGTPPAGWSHRAGSSPALPR